MRILFVSNGLQGGGIERAVSLLTQGFTELGHSPAVTTSDPPDGLDFALAPGTARWYFGWSRPRWFPPPLGVAVRLGRLVRQIHAYRPDVVIAKGLAVYVQAILAGLVTGRPVIACEHTNPFVHQATGCWRWLGNRLLPWARARVCLTESFARDPRVRGKWTVIPNPLLPVGGAAPARERIVLCVGRLDEGKNFSLAIRGFAASGMASEGWRLVICGRGPEEERLRELARGLPVEFPGYVPLEEFYRRASVLLMTSRYEGFPYVLLEGFQHGLAVAAMDCQFGPRDLIRSGENGLLLSGPDEVAEALHVLCGDGTLRERLGAQAVEDVQRYALTEVCQEWQRLFEELGLC